MRNKFRPSQRAYKPPALVLCVSGATFSRLRNVSHPVSLGMQKAGLEIGSSFSHRVRKTWESGQVRPVPAIGHCSVHHTQRRIHQT